MMSDYIDIDTPIDVAVYQSNRRIKVTLRQILESNDSKYERADVRPVVTCGECIYFRLNSCMRWADGTFMERTDFCSRAAKREES